MISSIPEADRIRWLSYYNGTGGEIPGFALLVPTGATSDGTLTVGQPTQDGQAVFVNGPVPCPAGGYGLCTPDAPVFALYDSAATPAAGETWGAAAGSWKLTTGKKGWRILGGNDTTRTLTLADHGAGETLAVVTNVCPIRSSGGVLTGLTVERRTVTLPPGTVVGSPACQNNPAVCCTVSGSGSGGSPSTVWVSCCPGVALPTSLAASSSSSWGPLDSLSVTLDWSAGEFWTQDPYSPSTVNGSAFYLSLLCVGGTFAVTFAQVPTGGAAFVGGTVTSLTCDPFALVIEYTLPDTLADYYGAPHGTTVTFTFGAGTVPPEPDPGTGLACCDVALPTTLTLTLPDTSEETLTYNPATGHWEGATQEFFCGDSTKGAFGMIVLSIAAVPVFAATCDPPYWEWHDGSDVYTVTE